MIQGKGFGSNDDIITAVESYFEAEILNRFYTLYTDSIEKLEKRWYDCIADVDG